MLPRAFDHARTRPQPRALPLKYEHDRLSCDQAHDSRMAALKKEVETLRMDNAALSQQVGRYTKDFEVCATREEFEGEKAGRVAAESTVEKLSEVIEAHLGEISQLRISLEAAEARAEALSEELGGCSPRPDWAGLAERAAAEAATIARHMPGGPLLLGRKTGVAAAQPGGSARARDGTSPLQVGGEASGDGGGGGEGGGGNGAGSGADGGGEGGEGGGGAKSGGGEAVDVDPIAALSAEVERLRGIGGMATAAQSALHLGGTSASSASRLVDQLIDTWKELAESAHTTPADEPCTLHPSLMLPADEPCPFPYASGA